MKEKSVMEYRIVNMLDYSGGLDAGIKFYHSAWGNEKNYEFIEDAIKHSTNSKTGLPRFYVLLKSENIVGCIALIACDFTSRQDLQPWIAGVYVNKNERGKELGNFMIQHLELEAKQANYSTLYLTTDHDGYYEKYGWTRMVDGFERSGKPTRIYKKEI